MKPQVAADNRRCTRMSTKGGTGFPACAPRVRPLWVTSRKAG